jgi:hypothetical protein
MAEHSIAAYKLTVHKRMKKEPLPFENFDENGSDLLKVFYGYSAYLRDDGFDHQDNSQILKGLEINRPNRHIQLKLGLGEYGLTSRFEERGTGTPRFNRETSDVEFMSYRNLLVVPYGRTVGLFLTERVQNRGVYSMFSTGLRRAFAKKYPGYVLDVNNLSPEAAVARILDSGRVKKIRLVRNSVPQDIADRYELGAHETELGTMETVLVAPRRGSLGKKKLEKIIKGEENVSSLLEFQGVSYQDIRAEVQVGRSTRTVSVASGKTPVVTFEIDGSVLDQDGNLADSVFYEEANKVALDLAEDIGLSRPSVAEQEFLWPQSWDSYRLEVPPSEDAQP